MFKLRFTTRTLTTLALLTAMEIVLSRFLSLNTWNMKIGFNFIPVVIAAILYGPIGAYFPGFTLTAFLTGCVYGLFLYQKQGWLQVTASVLINQLILSLLLNTLWISVLYGSPYGPLLATRLIQCGVQIAVQLVLIPIIARVLTRYGKKVFSR